MFHLIFQPFPKSSTNPVDSSILKTMIIDSTTKHVASTPFVPFQVTKKQKQYVDFLCFDIICLNICFIIEFVCRRSMNHDQQKDKIEPVVVNNDASGNANNNRKPDPKPQVWIKF